MRNKVANKIIELIKAKMPGTDEHFITMMVLNKLGQVAANMRIKFRYFDGGIIPVNFYGMMLASSGANKGKITNLLEDNFIKGFQDRFMNNLAPEVSIRRLEELAEAKSIRDGIDVTQAQSEIYKEWNRLPKHLYSFSDATIEGIKAKRVKLSMIELGSTNLEIDEIALNLERVSDVLGVFLEAFDTGKAKQKLIKVESNSETAKVPANAFFFGTPTRLLNGSKTEKVFIDMLAQGYGRRMFFGYLNEDDGEIITSAHDRLMAMRNLEISSDINDMKQHIEKFASRSYINMVLNIDDEVATYLLEYEANCIHKAKELKKHQEIKKAELVHRYWKVIKLAGILAFIDDRDYISMEDISDAIDVAETSGKAFRRIMDRPANHERLFEFLIDQGKKITQAELVDQLDFYNSMGKLQKEETIVLATAYAYLNNAVIKRKVSEGIEFISANVLEPSDGSKCILSISNDIVRNYDNKLGEFKNLKNVLRSSLEYCNHHFRDGYRDGEHAYEKFNLIILDIDDGTPLQLAMAMMSDYTYVIGTTKSHQKEKNGHICDRYRMVLLLDRTIELNRDDYSKFMENIYDWLPFEVDKVTKDIARKFSGHPEAMIFENEGKSIESIDFIPDTTKEKRMREKITDLSNLDSLERWFVFNASEGERNHKTLRYALMLCDGGFDAETIEERVLAMNNRLDHPLPEKEIYQTIMRTVRKRLEEIE